MLHSNWLGIDLLQWPIRWSPISAVMTFCLFLMSIALLLNSDFIRRKGNTLKVSLSVFSNKFLPIKINAIDFEDQPQIIDDRVSRTFCRKCWQLFDLCYAGDPTTSSTGLGQEVRTLACSIPDNLVSKLHLFFDWENRPGHGFNLGLPPRRRPSPSPAPSGPMTLARRKSRRYLIVLYCRGMCYCPNWKTGRIRGRASQIKRKRKWERGEKKNRGKGI